MKYLITLILCLFLLQIYVFCQENVIIEKSNNTSETHSFSDIDSIVIKKAKILVPVIYEVKPNKAKSNDTISIIGLNFGKSRDSWVSFGGIKSNEIFWSDTEIKAIVPNIDKDCKVYVVIDEEIRSNGVDFIIDTTVVNIIPVINSIIPNEAESGDTIIIKGINFGNNINSYVSFGGVKSNDIFWSDTLIKTIVPLITGTFKIFIVINDTLVSNGIDFSVKETIKNIITTISGRITDFSGFPIENAIVTTNSFSTVSDSNGLFLFENIEVAENRCFVFCKKDGYYDAIRASIPSNNGVTEIRVTMFIKDTPTIIETNTGGTAYLNDNAKIIFPANCFKKADGTVFNGNAVVSSRFVNPNDSIFNDIFPGDSKAIRKDGSNSILFSYGVYPVDIKTTNGEDLFMRDGYTAEISFMNHNGVPADTETIPSWYFDYDIGMWIEDTEFIRIGDRFVSEATHFSNYNCDVPMPPATIKGRVVSCNDFIPLSGVKVNVGQVQATSDNRGYFSTNIPSGFSYNISVAQPRKSNVVITPSLSPGQTFDGVILVVEESSVLKGTIKDCNNLPLSKHIYATWGITGFSTQFAKDGIFNLNVEPGYPITLKCGNTLKSIEPLDSCFTKNIGDFIVCDSIGNSIIDMVLIPEGRFRMGQIPYALPLHYVNITKPFYMSSFEVTQGQWKEVFGSLPYPDNNQDELPVVQVAWKDAIDFCNYLSDMENLQRCYKDTTSSRIFWDTTANGYRLPTEAEWEYACRAGTQTDFYTGNRTQDNCQPLDTLLNLAAWYCGNSLNSVKPVGLKLPNSFGLFDMHGNVEEWVWDYPYNYTSEERTTSIKKIIRIHYTSESSYASFISRGGSVASNDKTLTCLSAYRKFWYINSYLPVVKNSYTGFRVVRNK